MEGTGGRIDVGRERTNDVDNAVKGNQPELEEQRKKTELRLSTVTMPVNGNEGIK